MHTITINGLEARVTIEHGHETSTAYGIVFDETATVVTEEPSRRFSGFCDAEILYAIVGDMLASRRGIEYADIAHAISEECRCDN